MERRPCGHKVQGWQAKDRRGVKQKVLIAGGGVAGLEAALALRDLAADQVEVALA